MVREVKIIGKRAGVGQVRFIDGQSLVEMQTIPENTGAGD
jgi:hypothetical protein